MRRGHLSSRGFTLVEAVISMTIVAVAVMGALASLLFVRETMEVDKQRIVALNHCRRQVELIRRNLFTSISSESVVIDNFNTPEDLDDDLVGNMATQVWEVGADGSIGTEITSFPLEERERVMVQVQVSWNRLGRQSPRIATEVLRTYVSPR